jgi:hypothetical protein
MTDMPHILVVDDDEDILSLLTAFFGSGEICAHSEVWQRK